MTNKELFDKHLQETQLKYKNKLSEPTIKKLFEQAYEDEHSQGYEAVTDQVEHLADLILDSAEYKQMRVLAEFIDEVYWSDRGSQHTVNSILEFSNKDGKYDFIKAYLQPTK